MATTISNQGLQTIGQKAVIALSGFQDSMAPFTIAYDGNVFKGDAVKVPVFSYGATSTSSDFQTDDSNSATLVSVIANTVAKQQIDLAPQDFDRLKGVSEAMVKGMIIKAAKNVSDAAYTLLNSSFTFTAGNKAVVAAWSEAAPTLAALQATVGTALATGKIDPSNVIVGMPSSTYFAFMAVLNALPRDVNLGFKIVPVFSSAITKTFITDASAVGVGLAADNGTNYEEVENFTTENDSLGYALHVIHQPAKQVVTTGVRLIYGTALLNSTGLLWAANA